MNRYDVAKNPKDNKWYVIGCLGHNNKGRQEWMAVSTAYADRNTAIAHMKRQYMADRAATSELASV